MNQNSQDSRLHSAASESDFNAGTNREVKTEPVAIIGIGCRFPGGATSPETFWRLLRDGVDAITEIPANRLDIDTLYDPRPGTPGKIVARQGGFLEDLDQFDPYSFGISPREATYVDPQQRLLLEVVWEAFEDAGIVHDKLNGSRTGVFIGMWTNDYESYMYGASTDIDLYMTTGGGRYSASGRLSYVFNLQGPSLTIDTACSSSLVAVHLACQSLRSGESELALAGGVNLILQPHITIGYSKSRMLSPDGRCKFGDAQADGYVRSEGVGVILLKPVTRALADGDPIYAVILGSAVNNDGQAGLFVAPSRQGQEAVLRQAYHNAGVLPSRVHYIEAHGTGTAVGDPVEIQALGTVLAEGRRKDRPFLVGSIKTNIGHTEAASGVAGVIKAALSLKHRLIPPSLHLKTPNPNIPWDDLPLRVAQELSPMSADSEFALAGVNSFGVTGTNSHVVLQELPLASQAKIRDPARDQVEHPPFFLPLSAPRIEALEAMGRVWSDFLTGDEGRSHSLRDICYTAGVRRTHHDHRLALVGKSREELAERLKSFVRGEFVPALSRGQRLQDREEKLVFVFSGQGPQWFAMGRELLERRSVYRETIERCDRLLRGYADWSLLAELTADVSHSRLDQTEIAQPAIFALQMGLATLWRSWGIEPDAVVGHSVGEVAAACVAGVLDLEQAIRLVFHRGRLLQRATGRGKMAAAELSLQEAERLLTAYQGRLSIAAINSPTSVVISGAAEALHEVLNLLREGQKFCSMLKVDYAFHSPQMESYQSELVQALQGLDPQPSTIPIISSVTGKAAAGEDFGAEYWARNVRQQVKFAPAIDGLIRDGHGLFLELSPHPVLVAAISECLRHRGAQGKVLASLRRGQDEQETMLEALAALYVQGRRIDWKGICPDFGRCVRLPSYPWQKERFWLEKATADGVPGTIFHVPHRRDDDTQDHRLLGRHLQSSVDPSTHFWEVNLNSGSTPFLNDHRIQGAAVLPAAVFLEMALAAAHEAFGAGPHVVENMAFKQALILRQHETRMVQLVLASTILGNVSFQFLSRTDGRGASWNCHAEGDIQLGCAGPTMEQIAHAPPVEMQPHFSSSMASVDFYRGMHERGLQYGPSFQGVEKVWLRDGEALGKLRRASNADGEVGVFSLAPAVLDACFQLLVAIAPHKKSGSEALGMFVPVGLDRLQIYSRCAPNAALWGHAIHRPDHEGSADRFAGDVFLLNDEGRVIADVRGLRLQRLERDRGQEIRDWLYKIQWMPMRRQALQSKHRAPDYIPATAQIAERVGAATRQSFASESGNLAREILPQLDALCAGYVTQALRLLGWEFPLGERISTGQLADRLGVANQHRRMLGRLLEILYEEGMLGRADSAWEVLSPLQYDDPQKRCASLLSQHPDCDAELTLLGRCGQHLAEVLRGECDPLQLLFPEGRLETAGKLYRDAPFSRDCNVMMRATMAAALAGLPTGRRVRILEIGAGTGGTTAHVLPILPVDRSEYVFTDVSNLFTTKAEQKFRAYPFVQYRLLDISRDPKEQGYELHQFDLILAANVLHATPDLRETLRHVRQMLAPRGLLLLLEGTNPQRWVDLIFGLTEGWWLFSDLELRPSHPLVSRRRWPGLLEEVGFAEAVAIPIADDPRGSLFDQTVLLAHGPEVEEKPDGKESAAPPVKQRQRQRGKAEQSWLVFADEGGVGDKLAQTLRASGDHCILVHAGDEYKASPNSRFRINPTHAEDFGRLIKEAFSTDGQQCREIVHLWAVDAPLVDEVNRARLDEVQMRLCGSALHLVQALAGAQRAESPRLWLVTRGAQPVGFASAPLSVLQAPLWGLGRVIALEHPYLRCSLVDLDPADASDGVEALLDEILADEAEDQVAFRGGERYAARLVRSTPAAPIAEPKLQVPDNRPFQLQIPTRGVMDNLTLQPVTRCRPKPGEVEIRIVATGLNFRDVLNVLGAYPGDPGSLGLECAGRVVAVGAGVEEFQIGDEVIAFAQGTFSSFTTVSADFVAHKPEHLSLEEAATIPVAFLTADYTLRRLAKIKRGDRVLIHAASGGVGMAALQLAQYAGAEIFATAGNPEKREFLKSLGVQHVMDSRSLCFADEVMDTTRGQGVDIVLNSLAGEFIAKSLSVLGPAGRFLEIGKTGVRTEGQVKELKKDCWYFLFDLIETANNDPSCIGAMLRALVGQFNGGVLKPLPFRVFPIEDTINAFRVMSEATHIGKIVVSQKESPATPSKEARRLFRSDGAYLITGGFGGLGLLTARWMVERGAQCLALAGHRGASERVREVLTELERMGARVLALQGDVSCEDDVKRILAEIGQAMPPLRGVIHCAGVLDDGVLLRQDRDRFARVMAPKVAGTWNLHTLTRGLPLDLFVLFSSWASVLGSPGQGNHAAANAFMDALAHYRRAQGRPALSINWGPWSEVGATAASAERGESLAFRGIGSFRPAQGLKALQQLLEENFIQAAVMPFDVNRWRKAHSTAGKFALFEELECERDSDPERTKTPGAEADIRQALEAVSAGRQRRVLLESHIQEQVGQVLRLSSSRMEPHKPFKTLGLDSLTALELCNRLEVSLRLTLPATLVWNYPTIALLAPHLAGMMGIPLEDMTDRWAQQGKQSESRQGEKEEIEQILRDVEQLSDSDVRLILDEESS